MSAGVLIDSAIEQFINHLKVVRQASHHTLAAYSTDLSQWVGFLEETLGTDSIHLSDVTQRSIRQFLATLTQSGQGKKTIARKLSSIRSFLKYLCREGLISENLAVNIVSPSSSTSNACS